MAKLMCCVVLGLCLMVSNIRAAGLLDNLPVSLPPVVGDLLGSLLPCVFNCPCSTGPCVPKLGLDPVAGLKCLDVTANLNLSCPSLTAEADVCCQVGALCYTSCGTGKQVCDLKIEACLLVLKLKLSLCDPKALDVDLKALTASLTLCDRYRDAQKYGCDCGGGNGTSGAPGGGGSEAPGVTGAPDGGESGAPGGGGNGGPGEGISGAPGGGVSGAPGGGLGGAPGGGVSGAPGGGVSGAPGLGNGGGP